MSSKLRIVLISVGIFLVSVVAFFFFAVSGKSDISFLNNISGDDKGVVAGVNSEQDNDYVNKLAKYLTAQGAVLYGAYWCPHCQEQKKLFGEAAQYLNYVECDPTGQNANPDECRGQNVKSYPTWIFQGQQHVGTQSLSQLAEITGFTK